MWHRLDWILNGRRRPSHAGERCEACGGPLWPGPALVVEISLSEGRRRFCSPECLPPALRTLTGRQKLSGCRFPAVKRIVSENREAAERGRIDPV